MGYTVEKIPVSFDIRSVLHEIDSNYPRNEKPAYNKTHCWFIYN